MVAAAHTLRHGGHTLVIEKEAQLSQPKENSTREMGNMWRFNNPGTARKGHNIHIALPHSLGWLMGAQWWWAHARS